MEDIKKIIGMNLKYIRYQSGLSQEKFYEQYDLNPKYLACIERGEINISVNFLFALAKTFDISVGELVTFDEQKIISKKRVDEKKKQTT